MSEPATNDVWSKTNYIPELQEGDLQIWRLDLDGPEGRGLLAQAFEALTAEERQRAAKMRSGTAPEEFIAGRGSLRRLLSDFFKCDPRGIGIVNGPHRKPALRPVRGIRLPHFNVSHSRGMVLIALSRRGPVGVDVEFMDSAVETMDVARAAFHPDDVRRIERAGSPEEKLLAFYGCWTRREAVAKADGRGLTLPASGFATGTSSQIEQAVEVFSESAISSAGRGCSRYFVRSLRVSPCHLGGIAAACSCVRPTLLDFSCALNAQDRPAYASANRSSTAIPRSSGKAITFFQMKTNLSGD